MLNRIIFEFRRIPTPAKVAMCMLISLTVIGIIGNVAIWAAIRFFPIAAREQYLSHRSLASMFIGRTG